MLTKKIDCVFLVVSSSKKTYQNLSETYSAIEPPTWALLLAQSTRSVGFEVRILDANAERINEEQILSRLKDLDPKIICIVTYGQNVNTGTTIMSGATYISKFLKNNKIKQKICFLGSHVQALPKETLEKEDSIDFIFTNEGVYALRNI
jgi:anaerobic magnesium-protoporphyrin IX monomethyl ester cyclase